MFNRIKIKNAFSSANSIFLLVVFVVVFLNACSGITPVKDKVSSEITFTDEKENTKKKFVELESRVVTALDLQAVKSIEAITPRLARYRAVLVGESHTSYGDHLNQLAVIENLHKHWKDMVIGLEFIQQPFQKALDDYVACRLSEFDMLQQTQWYKRWKYDFRLYRPIFEFARLKKVPLIALNIPTELTKRIRKVGLNGLTLQQRQQLPKTIDKSNDTYAAHLKRIFKLHHSHRPKNTKKKSEDSLKNGFDRFYEAQLAWDEGMADTAAAYLLKHPTHHMVLLAGGGHMINRHGIPARLERRIRSKVVVVLNSVNGHPTASNGDFLLFSSEVALPKSGLLGVFMKQKGQKVVISALVPNGAAKKAGFKKGDIFLSIADNAVKDIGDVKLLLLDAEPNEKRVVSILRGNTVLKKTIILK